MGVTNFDCISGSISVPNTVQVDSLFPLLGSLLSRIMHSIKWKFHIAAKYFHIYAKLFTQRSKGVGGAGKGGGGRGRLTKCGGLAGCYVVVVCAWSVKIITLKLILFIRMCVWYACVFLYVCVSVYLLCVCVCLQMCNAIIVEVFAMKALRL